MSYTVIKMCHRAGLHSLKEPSQLTCFLQRTKRKCCSAASQTGRFQNWVAPTAQSIERYFHFRLAQAPRSYCGRGATLDKGSERADESTLAPHALPLRVLGRASRHCPSASFTRLPRRLRTTASPLRRSAGAGVCSSAGRQPQRLHGHCQAGVPQASLLCLGRALSLLVSRGGGGSRRPGCCRPAHLLELHGECDVFSPATSMGHDWASPGQVQRGSWWRSG